MSLPVAAACGLLGLGMGAVARAVIDQAAGATVPSRSAPGSRRHAPRPAGRLFAASVNALSDRPRGAGWPIKLGTAGLFAAVGNRIGWDVALPGYLLFAWTLLVLAVIDIRTRRIPNRLTYPLTPTLLALLGLAALSHGEPVSVLRSLAAGLAASSLLGVLALTRPDDLGLGDVKLAAFVGAGLGYLGWGHLLLGLSTGLLLGALWAIVLLAAGAAGPRDSMPFGPSLAAGALLAVTAGHRLL